MRTWTTAVAALAAMAATAGDSTADFRQRYEIDAARGAANAAKVAADLAAAGCAGAPVAVYQVPALSAKMRLPDAYPGDGEAFAPVRYVASRGEFEPASFLLCATGADHAGVMLKSSDLVGPGGARIPAAAVDFTVIKVWYQSGSAWFGYFNDVLTQMLVPELLLHDENLIRVDCATKSNYVRYENADGDRRWVWMNSRLEVTDYHLDGQAVMPLIRDAETLRPFALNRGEFKQFFATLHVPADAKPGTYRGTFEVVAGKGTLARMQVLLKVLPIDLPEPKTAYNPDKGFFFNFYCAASRFPKSLKNLAEHGAKNPMCFPSMQTMNPRQIREDKEFAEAFGLNVRPIFAGVVNCGEIIRGNPPTKEEQEKLDALHAEIERARKIALEHFGHDDIYSYGIDEGGPWQIRGERPSWREVHAAGGKTMVTSMAWQDLLCDLDFLVLPGMPAKPREKEVAKFHEMNPGGLCGWYANPHCGPENPDYMRRIHGLTAWKAGYDVSANYCWNRNNWNDTAPLLEAAFRGLVMVYGASDDVIDTLAWEGVREASDDIRYATLAKSLAARAQASKAPSAQALGRRVNAFIAYWDGYRDDPDAFRMECISWILKLNAELAKEVRK